MNNSLGTTSADVCGPLMTGVFFGTLALGAYLGYRLAPKHPMMGGVFGLAVFVVPAGVGAYMAAGVANCGS